MLRISAIVAIAVLVALVGTFTRFDVGAPAPTLSARGHDQQDQGDRDQGDKDQGQQDEGQKDEGQQDQGERDQGQQDQVQFDPSSLGGVATFDATGGEKGTIALDFDLSAFRGSNGVLEGPSGTGVSGDGLPDLTGFAGILTKPGLDDLGGTRDFTFDASAFGDRGVPSGFDFSSFGKDLSEIFRSSGGDDKFVQDDRDAPIIDDADPGLLNLKSLFGGGHEGDSRQAAALGSFSGFDVIGDLGEAGDVGKFGIVDDNGKFLDVSGLDRDFGDFFKRSDQSQSALDLLSGINPGEFGQLGGDFAVDTLEKLDFLGLHQAGGEAVKEMLSQAAGRGGPDWDPSQWAGALGTLDPAGIADLAEQDPDLLKKGLQTMDGDDILAIPGDEVLSLLRATVLDFDPVVEFGLDANLDQFSGQLDGMLGAMKFEHYQQIDDDQMLEIMRKLNIGAEGFDLAQTALQGSDVAGLVGSLDGDGTRELGERLLPAVQILSGQDWQGVDSQGAHNVFDTIFQNEGEDVALGLDNLGGIAGRFGLDQFQNVGNDTTFGILNAVDQADLSAWDNSAAFGAAATLDPSQLPQLDGQTLAGLLTGVGSEIFGLTGNHTDGFLAGLGAGDVLGLDEGVAGGLLAASGDDIILGLAQDTLGAYLEATGAGRLASPSDAGSGIVGDGGWLDLTGDIAGIDADVLSAISGGGTLSEIAQAAGGLSPFNNIFGPGTGAPSAPNLP